MKDLKIFTKNIEQSALDQIDNLIKLDPFKNSKIRIMPDVHTGVGCVIGFTGDLGDKVIPNIVGVDIGCGMLTVILGKEDIDLEILDQVIKNYIPSGFNVHEQRKRRFDLQDLKCYRYLKDTKRIERSLGTLGGGNHFIEIDQDDEENKYLIIHTGSRNLGHQVAKYYQNLAIELCSGKEEMYKEQEEIIKSYKEQGRRSEIQKALADLRKRYKDLKPDLPNDLCYLSSEFRDNYLHDMEICQRFASENRLEIANNILNNYFSKEYVVDSFTSNKWSYFETVHNYISFKDNIVRKGAISAYKDEIVLIPINMRDGCIIARGKGNEDWNNSAPHGAGRIMSRNEAREKLNFMDFQDAMKDIFSTTVVKETIDESPMAYKPIEEILSNIGDTVEIVKVIKPIYNFKAIE